MKPQFLITNQRISSYFTQYSIHKMSSLEGFGPADIGNSDNNSATTNSSTRIISWRERIDQSIATSRSVFGGNFAQLATVDQEGYPKCRTVVFRGFIGIKGREQEALRMMTDARSEKIAQIAHSDKCEMAYWFSTSKEQYRIAGTLELVHADSNCPELLKARDEQWKIMSPTAKQQFYMERQPGEIIQSSIIVKAEECPVIIDEMTPPPPTFVLMLLWPTQVKYLNLKDNYSQLDRLQANTSEWSSFQVV